jgi:hypothetical protein
MADFLRPEAKAALWRWREVLAGAGALTFGLWLVSTAFGAAWLIGWGLTFGGGALIYTGLQRGRFRHAGGGAGVVDIDERRITYFGPETGGSLALEDLDTLAVVRPHAWELTSSSAPPLLIPVDAEGAEALFDILSVLPGISAERLIAASREAPRNRTVLWSRPRTRIG